MLVAGKHVCRGERGNIHNKVGKNGYTVKRHHGQAEERKEKEKYYSELRGLSRASLCVDTG